MSSTDLRHTKKYILRAYWGLVTPPVWNFLAVRTILMPLEKYHQVLPKEGIIVEIGCGHGILSQYISKRSSKRKVVGLDPDRVNSSAALKARDSLENLEYHMDHFCSGVYTKIAGVIVLGFFYDPTIAGVKCWVRPGFIRSSP